MSIVDAGASHRSKWEADKSHWMRPPSYEEWLENRINELEPASAEAVLMPNWLKQITADCTDAERQQLESVIMSECAECGECHIGIVLKKGMCRACVAEKQTAILTRALLDIEGCAWGCGEGYNTAEEAAGWMNEQATLTLNKTIRA